MRIDQLRSLQAELSGIVAKSGESACPNVESRACVAWLPALSKRLIGRGWPKRRAAWGMIWCCPSWPKAELAWFRRRCPPRPPS